jgi:hypothetical protein
MCEVPLGLFMAVPKTISAAGDSFAERRDFWRQQNMKKIVFQIFSLFSPVSLTPLINIHSRIYLQNFKKI